MTELELVIREAEPQDAKSLIDFLNQVGKESDYMTLDAAGILMTEEQMSSFIQHQTASDNQIYLIALLDNEIAGLVALQLIFMSGFDILDRSLSWLKEHFGIKA